MHLQLEDLTTKGRAHYTVKGTTKAEMTYSKAGDTMLIIDHTEIAPELQGQGVGRKLLDVIVAHARERSLRILPLCPYAKSVFDKDASIRDVLK